MARTSFRLLFASLAAAGIAIALAAPASAQYFGKNRIQYSELDWKIYHSPHFDVYYYFEDDVQLKRIVSFAESAYDELSRELDHQLKDPIPLIVYETHSAFMRTNILHTEVPEGVGAFAEPRKFRMVMPIDLPDPEMLALVRHELTHIFQYHIMSRGRVGLSAAPPQWFMEGMASYFGRDELVTDKKYMIDAVVNDNIPSVETQGGGFLAYRFGNAMFSFIEERWGKDAVLDLIYEFRNTFGSRIGKSIERTFKMDVEDFDAEFRRWARKKYLPELLSTGEPGDFGKPFRLERGEIGNEMSPVASPSGDLVAAVTTDRGELDISLFDTKSRRRIRTLTRGIDTQIREIVVRNSRQIGGDLAFSPDGNTIAAFGRREAGRSLLLFDALSGKLRRIIDMEVEQQRSPAYSPDARKIAFAGNKGGVNDIYLFDLDTLEVQNVTQDEAFDSAPTFSPDGRWLTYSSILGERWQIIKLDLQDPAKRYQVTRGEFSNKEPEYSRDGTRLYFASDRSGADNIYGLTLATGEVRQYTNAITGCDRPTVLNLPDGGEKLVYASFWNGRFTLYNTDVQEPIGEATSMPQSTEPAPPGSMPRFEPDIEVAIDDANKDDYGGFKFFLEDVTNYVGIDTDSVLSGRILLTFTDYLGDRNFIVNLAAVETISDFDLIYLDLRKRRQWGARIFDNRSFAYVVDQTQTRYDRIKILSETGAEYLNIFPLSFSRRFELTAGYYWRDINGSLFEFDQDLNPVEVIAPRKDDYPKLTAAFVSDTTVYNNWGPAAGHRVRLSASYAWDPDPLDSEGSSLAETITLDARKYIPLTQRSAIAMRLFAFDSDGNAPDPVFIGGLDTIRGYNTRSIAGFRAVYANFELRFPLIDQLAIPGIGFRGIRGVIFVDVGTAYFPGVTDFDFIDDDNRLDDGFAAFGWGFDMNLLGLPAHWDFAKRTDFKDHESFDTSFWIGFRF
jgi:Tol biopolymer transport system component